MGRQIIKDLNDFASARRSFSLDAETGYPIYENFSFQGEAIIKYQKGNHFFNGHGHSELGFRVSNCDFRSLKISAPHGNFNLGLIFENCEFDEIIMDGINFKSPVKFYSSIFESKTNFNNTRFEKLADFFDCTFLGSVNFYKTDFVGNAVFSAAIFDENVLFTYSTFEAAFILRDTDIKKGIDISLAIFGSDAKIYPFGIKLDDKKYETFNKPNLSDLEYEESISGRRIPRKNKRESYRIIKNHLLAENNVIEALRFSYLEKQTYWKEVFYEVFIPHDYSDEKYEIHFRDNEWFLFYRIIELFEPIPSWIWKFVLLIPRRLTNIGNFLLLTLNKVSNNFGTSYWFGIIFTLLVGLYFFKMSLGVTINEPTTILDILTNMESHFESFFKFLIPTRGFDYLGDDYKSLINNDWFYFYDTLGRIFVGYGIYQTVQAFRKFK